MRRLGRRRLLTSLLASLMGWVKRLICMFICVVSLPGCRTLVAVGTLAAEHSKVRTVLGSSVVDVAMPRSLSFCRRTPPPSQSLTPLVCPPVCFTGASAGP